MASDQKFVDYVVAQLAQAGVITARKMFGDYGLYADEKLFGVISDDRLFVKPTAAGRAFIGTPVEAPAYDGAKPSFLIEDRLEDRDWLGTLVRLTVDALPAPKPKKKKAASKQEHKTS